MVSIFANGFFLDFNNFLPVTCCCGLKRLMTGDVSEQTQDPCPHCQNCKYWEVLVGKYSLLWNHFSGKLISLYAQNSDLKDKSKPICMILL